MANNSATDLKISNGTLSTTSITVPKSYTGVGVNFNDGLIFNGGTITVSGNILLANASSEASMSVGGATVTVGGNVILGQQTSAGRGGHLQVTDGVLTISDTVNGLVFVSHTTANQSSTATFSGGESLVQLIKFGLNSSVGAGNVGTMTLSGGDLYIGAGGIQNPGTGMTVNISLASGILGATADWNSPVNMVLGGATVQASDDSDTPHNITLTGVLSGSSGLTKTGAGTLTLAGSNTYTGSTIVGEGTLTLSGSITASSRTTVQNSAIFALSGGALTTGTLTVDSGGTFTGCGTITGAVINNGTILSTCGNTLVVSGSVTNNGTMRITNGTTLQAGGKFTNNGVLDIMTAGLPLPANFVNNGVVLDSSVVRILNISNTAGNTEIDIQSYVGHSYQLQSSSDLSPGSWSPIGAAQPGTGSVLQLFDAAPGSGGGRFYRVIVAP